jgi:hypothetical protein
MVLSFVSILPLLSHCVFGWWIGRFYKLKFGESSHSWILLTGGILGSLGLFLFDQPSGGLLAGHEVLTVLGQVLMLIGGLMVAGGAFWLWYLLMGARRG